MNVVLIMNDTLRYDHLGANGNQWIHTPVLDQFASESAVFDRHYLASFPTVPNRHEMMKGCYGSPFQQWGPLQWDVKTLPEVLRDNGYVTMFIHDTPHLMNYGYGFDRPFHAWDMIRGNESDRSRTDYFDELYIPNPDQQQPPDRISSYRRHHEPMINEEDRFAPRVMSSACKWLERNAGHENFFLWIDSFDPHEPWDPPQHYVDLYSPNWEGADLRWPSLGPVNDRYDESELNHIRGLYAGEVTMVDKSIGQVLDTIDTLGLRDNTIVLICSDHGFGLGETGFLGKRPFYSDTLHTVMMVRHPSGLGSSTRVPGLTQHPDFAPSIMDLLNIDLPDEMDIQGKSWVPLLEGTEDNIRNATFSGTYPFVVPENHPISAYIGFEGWSPITVITEDWWLIDQPGNGSKQLFDARKDPLQQHNLIEQYPDIAEKLRVELINFLKETRSPDWLIQLWQGDPSAANANQEMGTAFFSNANVFTRGRPAANPLIGNIKYPEGYNPLSLAEQLDKK